MSNPYCDGGHCRSATGEVRLYPLGGGANLILCMACAAYQNRYRYERGRETKCPENWPQVNWHACEVYAPSADSPELGQFEAVARRRDERP